MSEVQRPEPNSAAWVQFREDMITAREARRMAVLGAVRRFVDANPRIGRHPRRKAVLEARLQLREDRLGARFGFRRAVARNVGELVSAS